MKTALTLGIFATLLVVAQYVDPGQAIYHAGWYNVVIAAAAIWVLLAVRGAAGSMTAPRARGGAWLFAFGACAVAFAGVASGLLGPDNRTIVGAPGASISDPQAGGQLVFPLAQDGDAAVMLERGGRASAIGRIRFTPNGLLRSVPRTVVAIDARDARGGHVTITQPTGAAFLSPVLLMQAKQTIDGLSLPYDSFALPALHRIVKAVLFSAQEAASLPALAAQNGAVVLFDLEDDTGASLPGGIGIAGDGRSVLLGGVRLRPTILDYPAIETISIPNLYVAFAGIIAIFAGVLLTADRTRGKIAQR